MQQLALEGKRIRRGACTVDNEIMVTVLCTVYNHEKYIKKCLDSLVEQETTFPYEIIVHDDASTDESAEIIRQYAERYECIVPMYQTENQYSKGVRPLHYMMPRARGKYIAICEGDDFWTCREKLQRQVSFMEDHPEYSLCVHAAYYANEDDSINKEKFFKPYEENRTVGTEEILTGWKFATNSVLYRKSARDVLEIPYQQNCANGDFATVTYLSLKGKVYYFSDIMSAYRETSVGSMNWVWKRNAAKYVQGRRDFAQMLERIDSYTEGVYHTVIDEHISRVEFSIAYTEGDLRKAKEYKEQYGKLGIKEKGKLYVQRFLPKIYQLIRCHML